MKHKKDLLLEIGTEELPPKSLKLLSEHLAQSIEQGLQKIELNHGEIKTFATPRRLAVLIKGLQSEQSDRTIERRGPALSAAYDPQGKPTNVCEGFARSCGVQVQDLKTIKTDKGEWIFCEIHQKGKSVSELIPDIITQALSTLPIPKPMRWGNHTTEFIRPVHWVVLIYGKDIIPADILGNKTSNKTFGHRFLYPKALTITSPASYEKLLETKAFIIPDFIKRREEIKKQIIECAKKISAEAIIEEDLLNEVTGIVEWPKALLCQFGSEFLTVPAEALIAAMRDHQKSFSLINHAKQLMPYFITISNIQSAEQKQLIHGYERVMRARLADASFFYREDQKQKLEDRLEKTKHVVQQAKLGSLYDKTERLSKLTASIAEKQQADIKKAERSGWLAKCDLMTQMVNEFPELQGIMGSYYAKNDGEPPEVVSALKEQYQPAFSGDQIPRSTLGCCLALADRLDNLVGAFGINQIPTGDKDPFGLRRAALGIVRIILEKKLPLNLPELLQKTVSGFKNPLPNDLVISQVHGFIIERLRAWYQDQGVSADVLHAVLARQSDDLLDIDTRIKAVTQFRSLEAAKSLAAAHKRVNNILKQANYTNNASVNMTLLESDAEKLLATLIEEKKNSVVPLFEAAKYQQGLSELASLREPVDQFFETVMVMVEEENIRKNRMALLSQLRDLFLHVADISLLQM
ncbi:MAG: glycine--tRNA ligase subunit beta [Proteobacteria bacterium]|nr:glycine--tRNA ligase subunit beta [Pseudomonadota bacterium]